MLHVLKSNKRKAMLIVASLALVILFSVGGTVAYLMSRGEPMRNIFEPAHVNCEVVYVNGTAAVKNTGDVEAYVRATLVTNWALVDEDGHTKGEIHAVSPKEGTDYRITYATEGWVQDEETGFWYYTLPVAAGETTPALILSIESITPPPTGYQLVSGVVGSAIQCDPADVVSTYWNVTVSTDGTLTVKNP